ncbi:MAG: histidine phosphatase family protein [Pseudomonadota bacterium]
MSTIFWVRHGPTHAKAAVGWTDLPADLTDKVRLDRVAAHLPQNAQFVTSDLSRTRDTGEALRRGRALLPERAGLREMHYGTWENRPFDEVAQEDPKLSRAFWTTPGDVAPPGGESWNTLRARVGAEVDALTPVLSETPLVVVAHFGVILAALQHATGMPATAAFGFKIDNLSVTQIDYIPKGQRWRVMCVNHHP